MIEVLGILKEFTPGAYGILYIAILVTGWIVRDWRETRKLSADDRLARREGYAKQAEMFMAENRGLRKDLAAVEERHDNYRKMCHAETDQLRDQVVYLNNRISGLLRKLADVAIRVSQGNVDPETAKLILQLAAETATPLAEHPPRQPTGN